MWIAFKNYYLRDEGQHGYGMDFGFVSCELLSKIIIFVMKDNTATLMLLIGLVVNCFQKLLSSWWRTAQHLFCWIFLLLWIAFKNYYLRDEGQPDEEITQWEKCCELLSKIIIFVMKDSFGSSDANFYPVVNCFQKLLSSWWRTAKHSFWIVYLLLWIAFKNYYLRDEGQQ